MKKKQKKTSFKPRWSILVVALAMILFGSFLLWQNYQAIKIPIRQLKPEKAIALKSAEPQISASPISNHNNLEKFQVPILMYHYIRVADPADTMGVALSVTPENFAAQMTWLSQNDYESMKLTDLADPAKTVLHKIEAKNKKPIIITFDDGYDNAYTQAMPILKKHDFTGTFFIIRHFVGRPEYATQTQIDQMAKASMEIGSHTLDHKDLAKNSIEVDHQQIFDSKLDANTFCYPSGRYTEETVNLVKEAGYVAAVTTRDGIANQDSSLFELPRVRIKNVDLETFANRVKGLK